MKARLFAALLTITILTLLGCQSQPGQETSATAVGVPSDAPVEPESPVAPLAAPTEDPTAAPAVESVSTNEPVAVAAPWWNDAVFYEVFLRSYYDSDGDGVGDINGLIERLDYLNDGDPATTDDLGISGIWLMPVMQSPSYHGYDVVDYYQIDDEFGSNEDFKRLIDEAHKRGIRVIVDLVLNHTSSQHPWFESAAADPNSAYRDYYVWEEENPGYRGPWGQQVWHETPTGYYYGVFWDGMPDLNYRNEAVTEEMHAATRYWLEEMGADGFRLDAVKYLVANDERQEGQPETHEWLEGFNDVYKGANPDAFAIGEIWSPTLEVVKYVGEELDAAFEFDLAEAILASVNSGRVDALTRAQKSVIEKYPPGQYGVFLTNHDQNRVMSQLLDSEEKAKLAATLLLTAPGVPFIYYGEEIGQTGSKPDEDIRRPLQWDNSANAGFSRGQPWRDPVEDYPQKNIADQSTDPDSLLSHYRSLIHLRNEQEALRTGEWLAVETNSSNVYAFLRHTDGEKILVLANLKRDAVDAYGLDLAEGPLIGQETAVSLNGLTDPATPTINGAGGFAGYKPFESLPPQSSSIILLE